MTKEWYQQHGYGVSVNIDQSQIDRAEADVMAAYVKPILPNADGTEENLQPLIADIAFLLLLQRSLKVTRKGAKVKTSTESTNEDTQAALREQAQTAAFAVQRMRGLEGAVKRAQVTDICKLSYKTQLLGVRYGIS